MKVTRIHHELHTVTRFWYLRVAISMTVTGINVAHNFDLTTATSYSMIQITVSMTVTWIHHVSEYELHTATRFWHLCVAILMTVAGIRAAHDFWWQSQRFVLHTIVARRGQWSKPVQRHKVLCANCAETTRMLITVKIPSMCQLAVSITVTWIHHALKHEVRTVTRFWHLLAAITGIRAARNFDLMTVACYTVIQPSASMTITWIHHTLKYEPNTVTRF